MSWRHYDITCTCSWTNKAKYIPRWIKYGFDDGWYFPISRKANMSTSAKIDIQAPCATSYHQMTTIEYTTLQLPHKASNAQLRLHGNWCRMDFAAKWSVKNIIVAFVANSSIYLCVEQFMCKPVLLQHWFTQKLSHTQKSWNAPFY